jgi:hypothetical protein
MNGSHKRSRNVVKPLIVAMALAMTGSAYAASMGDVVTTRADQNIDQQYGRDSVYAFSVDAKPLKPEQQGSSEASPFGKVKSYAANAWDKTRHFAGAMWDKTTGLLPHSSGTTTAQSQYDVQPYGRAGGYVGSDRIAVLESPNALAANSQNIVKTGEAQGNVADMRRSDMPVASNPTEPVPDRSALNESGDASATNGSGFTTESDPERIPNNAAPAESSDMSAADGLGSPPDSDSQRLTQ